MPKGFQGFQKGHPSFLTEETKQKISLALKGRTTKIKMICQICQKEFLIKPSRIKRYGGKYCSKSCYSKSMKGKRFSPETEFKKGIVPKTGFKKGIIPLSKSHPEIMPRGENHWNWQGGKIVDKKGRIFIYIPNHPFCDKHGYVFEHRLVAEKCLGRYLEPTETSHHIDFDPSNNKPENIFIFETTNEHTIFHLLIKYNPILKTFIESNLIIQ